MQPSEKGPERKKWSVYRALYGIAHYKKSLISCSDMNINLLFWGMGGGVYSKKSMNTDALVLIRYSIKACVP